jgi:hypothetical protein
MIDAHSHTVAELAVLAEPSKAAVRMVVIAIVILARQGTDVSEIVYVPRRAAVLVGIGLCGRRLRCGKHSCG